MLTATVRKGDEVITQIHAPDQERLDKALEPFLSDEHTVEQEGEPEPEGHDAPEEQPE